MCVKVTVTQSLHAWTCFVKGVRTCVFQLLCNSLSTGSMFEHLFAGHGKKWIIIFFLIRQKNKKKEKKVRRKKERKKKMMILVVLLLSVIFEKLGRSVGDFLKHRKDQYLGVLSTIFLKKQNKTKQNKQNKNKKHPVWTKSSAFHEKENKRERGTVSSLAQTYMFPKKIACRHKHRLTLQYWK